MGDKIVPEGFGLILRTECEGRTQEELGADVNFLRVEWQNVLRAAKRVRAPACVHRDQTLLYRTVRDLFDDEIDRMVKDAEVHAEEDRRFHELVTARNTADAIVHATRSSLKEMGDKLSEDERKEVEQAIEGVEEAMKGDDKATIEQAVEKLSTAGQVIHQKAAAEAQAQQEAPGEAKASDEDVVDAEFEEVKDKDRKAD